MRQRGNRHVLWVAAVAMLALAALTVGSPAGAQQRPSPAEPFDKVLGVKVPTAGTVAKDQLDSLQHPTPVEPFDQEFQMSKPGRGQTRNEQLQVLVELKAPGAAAVYVQ